MTTQPHRHAAPVIRGELIRAIHKGRTFALKRDQAAGMAQAYGLAEALRIMAHSQDQVPAPGIEEGVYLPAGALQLTREYLGLDADLILGTTPAPTTPQADLPTPIIPPIPKTNPA